MEKIIGTAIDKIIVEVVQNNYSVFAWRSLNGEIERCEFKVKALRKEYGEIELDIAENDKKMVADIITGKRELNIYIPDSSVSFVAMVKTVVTERKLKIYIPKTYEFFERRKHERVQPKKGFCSLELNKTIMKKPLFDVSLGGFAIVLPKAERISIKKGSIVESCILEINGRKIKVMLECVSSVSIDRYKLDSLPYGGNKISFRFLSMAKEDRDFLAQIVTIEAIQNKQLKGA